MKFQEEEFDEVILWVLQEIKKEALASEKDDEINFKFEQGDGKQVPTYKDQNRALKFLQKINLIKIKEGIYAYVDPIFKLQSFINQVEEKPTGYKLQISEKLDETYNRLKKSHISADQLLIEYRAKNNSKIDLKSNNNELIQYDKSTWDLFYKGKSLHHLNDGTTVSELFKHAFKDKDIKYEFTHGKDKNAKMNLQNNIKNFRTLIQNKLKKENAPQELIEDFFLKIDGGLIIFSKHFVSKP